MTVNPFKLECFSLTDIGKRRENNEDVFLEMPEYGFFALADGMGGHQAGEVAAKEAILQLGNSVKELESAPLWALEPLIAHIQKAVVNANSWVHHLAKQQEHFKGMGTTLSCFLIHKESLLFAHVGDSRLYRYRGSLTQLTEDHSLKRELIRKGELTLEEAATFTRNNVVTKAIGTSASVAPDVGTFSIEPGDVYFLCSDGLSDHLSDKTMEMILKTTTSIEDATMRLIEAALETGGRDNITIVMVKILP